MTYSSNHANSAGLPAKAAYGVWVGRAVVRVAAVALCLTSLVATAEKSLDLAELSLEELANVQVTSVSKHTQPLSKAPASVYVITAAEIRRSGATTIPEALRLAPNLHVARINAQNYAISARGFNHLLSNKLLVLIDGRAVYSPLFSGTFWSVQDVLLEDIDRIEVISGPGTTLWGANAVNGIINITTRSASETQGTLISVGAGNREAQAAVRYGGALKNGGSYRVYGKHSRHEGFLDEDTGVMAFDWERTQTGFRADWGRAASHLTVQGDAYTGDLEQTGSEEDVTVAGVNLIGRLSLDLQENSQFLLQTYVDHAQRHHAGLFIEHLNTLDVEMRHSMALAQRHNLMWGGGYRYLSDNIENQAYMFRPEDRTIQWGNLFIQDDIALHDRLQLTLGAKLERSSYTGWEFLPSFSLAWSLSDNQLLWTAWSRSVRSPSRAERDLHIPLQSTLPEGVRQYVLSGNDAFDSEIARVYELGYRAQLLPELSLSMTGFYGQYEKLRTLELNPEGAGYIFENRADGTSYGVEAWSTWQAHERLRISAGLVAQELDKEFKDDRRDLSLGTSLATHDPQFYWMLKSSYQVSDRIELFSFLRHVAELPDTNVPAYTTLNLRLGWQATPNLNLSVVGQNLFSESHAEYDNSSVHPEAVYFKAVWGL
jgi:iron complex outermembrane receptor protein